MSPHSYLLAPLLIVSVALYPLDLRAQKSFGASQRSPAEAEDLLESYAGRQTQQLGVYIGVDMAMGLGFRTSSLSYSDATAIIDASTTPKVGFFPINRLMVGGNFDFVGSIASFNAADSYAVYSKTWGGFMRYYLKGGFFGELQYNQGQGFERSTKQGLTDTQMFQTERYSVGVGLANFWTKYASFEVLLKYNSSNGQFNDTRDVYLSGLSITAGVGFTIAPLRK